MFWAIAVTFLLPFVVRVRPECNSRLKPLWSLLYVFAAPIALISSRIPATKSSAVFLIASASSTCCRVTTLFTFRDTNLLEFLKRASQEDDALNCG